MIVLEARNVNYALAQGVDFIHRSGVREPSRAGDVFRVLQPVTTVYENPVERVCLHPWRDANPFFHLIESLWMIAGRDDLGSLTRYVSTFGQFSDDGETVPGAYGKRWRDWSFSEFDGPIYSWGDQLDRVVEQLRANPRDRRVVIQMWDPAVDPDRVAGGGKDVPCNLTILPFETDGALNMTVFCRSNDMVLGAYGANAVHFSFLLEYLAARVGLEVGRYYQVSNNFHAYVENAGDPDACWPTAWGPVDPYAMGVVEPFPIFKDFDVPPWTVEPMKHQSHETELDAAREKMIQQDLKLLFDEGPEVANRAARWPFLRKVVAPMALAHRHWKGGKGEDRFTGALEILAQMPERNDWRLAAEEWIQRRYQKWSTANA
jgi:thymidylate synthase